MNFYKYLSIGCLVLLASSCKKELPFPDAEHQPQIVINSLFSPDEVLRVHLSESCHIKDLNCANKQVDNAEVLLKEANGTLIAKLEPIGEGMYSAAQATISPNTNYLIEVSHNSYEPNKAIAQCRVPKLINCTYVGKEEGIIDGKIAWGFDVSIEDDPSENNYYILEGTIDFEGRPHGNGVDETNGYVEPHFAHFTNDVNTENGTIASGFDYVSYPLRSIFLTDEAFNGQKYQTRFGIRDRDLYRNVYGIQFDPESENDNDTEAIKAPELENIKAHLSIKSVSKEMYEYYKTLELVRLSPANPFAEPQLIYSNIEGGLGIFAGYTEKRFTVDLPKSEYIMPDKLTVQNNGCQAPCTMTFLTDGGSKLNHNWDFGDGNTSTEPNPSHEYTTPGEYIISLGISREPGNISTWTQTVQVR